ncbi:MAG: transglycosylase SLT domain-containing protein [Gemmatimonadaceae bacterium]
MNRIALLGGLWASTACGQSVDSRAVTRAGEVDLRQVSPARVTSDPEVSRADSLVRAGRPWQATALLAQRLRTPATATAEARLVGARAAAGWEGWTEVDRLLAGAPWLDTQFGGEGRELLVRGALERGQDASANARLALGAATDEPTRVVREVLLARAFDRGNMQDSAAAAYVAAARRLPRVSDWLRLRAAGVTSDSARRAELFARVASTPAKARIPFTDAQARERAGDFAGAARAYRRAGDEGSAFRAEALDARDDASKRAVSRRIAAFLSGRPSPAEARQAIEVFDKVQASFSAPDELIIARAAAEHGSAARAVSGFERAGAASLSPRDRLAYGGALLRAGRAADAARQLGAITDSAVAPLAAYQRARALLQAGDGSGARAALRAIPTAYPNVAAAGAPALLLLADLQMDDGDVAGAAASLAELRRRYPSAPQAPLGGFRAGLIAWGSDPARAGAIFDSVAQRYPADEEAVAARYWAARAAERAGKHAEAERRWREIISTSPLSYYAMLSARQLRVPRWTPPAGPDTAPRLASADSALARVATLARLGMETESRFELDALAERADATPAEAPAIASALLSAGDPSRALRVAAKALGNGTPSRALFRAAYPVVDGDALVEQARRNGLDPALVAGLIRQESSFNPRAVSVAGARGLMQLMPAVGASIARGRGYPLWNPALLFEPDVSLELGTAHLASSLKPGTSISRALAAYNAGGSRVARWSQRPGSDDPELFAEWIPFTETRDYVRIVQRNADIYRALYGW